MDWIKSILEKHTKEDGTVDLAEANKEIDAEFPKKAVPKTDFNSKVEELRTANETLSTLQNSNKDNEGLQSKIAEYETEVQRLKTEQAEITKSYTLKDALAKEGALPDYIDLLLPTFKDLELDEDGSLKGLAEALEGIKTSKPALFQPPAPEENKAPNIMLGGTPKTGAQTAPDAFAAAVQKFI